VFELSVEGVWYLQSIEGRVGLEKPWCSEARRSESGSGWG
jgi:hypothetical protein